MKHLLSLSLLAAVLFTSACSKLRLKGEGDTISETRSVGSFIGVQSEGDVEVEIFPSNENKVIVTGYHNLLPVFKTDVSGDRLRLSFKDGYINVRNNNIKVTVYTTSLNSVKVNGSGRLSIKDSVKSDRMDAEVNGSGNINIANNSYYVMNLHVNGSGDINAQPCTANKVYAKVSGSGNVKITVTELLDAKISGSGDIDYWGNPATVTTDISGSGKIHKR